MWKSKAQAALFVVLPLALVRLHARLGTKLGNCPVTADKHLLGRIISKLREDGNCFNTTNIWSSNRSKAIWDLKNVSREREDKGISEREGPAEGFGLLQTTAQSNRRSVAEHIHRKCVSIHFISNSNQAEWAWHTSLHVLYHSDVKSLFRDA